ncbi:MAG: hypothetical protein CL677_09925 [Bdellovibrionaceae bacterium]|nr:hypothetical protein [Pseudobdellovibrionaceae bacterium]|tara:strand:- start:178430 stop:179428 length:999 start_codon:yes stop_codon:yes gene_type:complete
MDANIESLFKLHEEFQSVTPLSNVLGDGFLYRHNELYKNIRDVVLDLGYQFSKEGDAINQVYTDFSMLTLNRIYQQKTLPWKNNIEPFERLLENGFCTEHDVPWEVATFSSTVKNYILHESAHCISNEWLNGGGPLKYPGDILDKKFLMYFIGSESFANTIEIIFTYMQTELNHLKMADLNSYVKYSKSSQCVFNYLAYRHGAKLVFRYLFYSYVLCNFYFSRIDYNPMDSELILNHLGLSDLTEYEKQMFSDLNRQVYTLSIGFRESTSLLFLKYIGCEIEFVDDYGFNLENECFFKDCFAEFLRKCEKSLFSKNMAPVSLGSLGTEGIHV